MKSGCRAKSLQSSTRGAAMLVGLLASLAYTLPPNSLALTFGSPIMRVNLLDVLPEGTLEALEAAVMQSWSKHAAEQDRLPPSTMARRATTRGQRYRASSASELNEEFFYYQRENLVWMAMRARRVQAPGTRVAARRCSRGSQWRGRKLFRKLHTTRALTSESGANAYRRWLVDPDKLHMCASFTVARTMP